MSDDRSLSDAERHIAALEGQLAAALELADDWESPTFGPESVIRYREAARLVRKALGAVGCNRETP